MTKSESEYSSEKAQAITKHSLVTDISHFMTGHSSVEFQFHSLDLDDDSGADCGHYDRNVDRSRTGNKNQLVPLAVHSRSKSADCLQRYYDDRQSSPDASIKSMDDRMIGSSKIEVGNCTSLPNRTFKVIFVGDVSKVLGFLS